MYEYFQVKVVDPSADLLISVTPFSGDPDLYVGQPELPHPSKDNYTWASRGFGGDTITIQAEAMKEYCTPIPALGEGCDYYIGVYGWTNTSFSIMASLSMGWTRPIVLTPGQPQNGQVKKNGYQYFQVDIPEERGTPTIRFVLMATDDSDQDLYLTTSREKEPGRNSYDLKSTSWDETDEIVIEPDSIYYCQKCTLYLAVFGYEEGGFEIGLTIR